MKELTTKNVNEIFFSCLFKEEENKDNPVIAEGIQMKTGFHPGRLEEAKKDIKSMLDQLPDNFKASIGGGWSFLQMCVTKDEVQWGEHKNMDQLAMLAIAAKLGKWQLSRQLWASLPGGMPYFIILDKEPQKEEDPPELCYE